MWMFQVNNTKGREICLVDEGKVIPLKLCPWKPQFYESGYFAWIWVESSRVDFVSPWNITVAPNLFVDWSKSERSAIQSSVIDVCFKKSIKPSKFCSAKGFWIWTFLKLYAPKKVTGKVENELGRKSVELDPFAICTKTYIVAFT